MKIMVKEVEERKGKYEMQERKWEVNKKTHK